MRRPSRLPGRTTCLSSFFRSASRVRSRPSCVATVISPLSAKPGSRLEKALKQPGEGAMATTFDMNDLKRRMQGAIASIKQELPGLRTGRASSALLDHVQGEAYGSHMPLNQLATVSVPEPRLLNVQVWDRSQIHAVEKAISAANLGLSPSTEGQVLKLRIPELNGEGRKESA